MTCIVGYIEKEKVYIGGDSAGVGGLDVTIRKDPKVFKVGEFVFGCTSSFRMINILRFSLSIPALKEGEDVYKFMCTSFINAVRDAFKNAGFMQFEKHKEEGGTFLVGFRGRLFTIYDDLQVGETSDNYDSVGCGARYALGALFSIEDQSLKLTVQEKIEIALNCAVHFSAGVRPPFIIEST